MNDMISILVASVSCVLPAYGQPAASKAGAATQVHFEYQVETPVRQAPGSSQPTYPDALKKQGIEGEVQAQFVVDTMGLAEVHTFRIVKSPHELLSSAVRTALPSMRYVPAKIAGRKVKQVVTQRFLFDSTQ